MTRMRFKNTVEMAQTRVTEHIRKLNHRHIRCFQIITGYCHFQLPDIFKNGFSRVLFEVRNHDGRRKIAELINVGGGTRIKRRGMDFFKNIGEPPGALHIRFGIA